MYHKLSNGVVASGQQHVTGWLSHAFAFWPSDAFGDDLNKEAPIQPQPNQNWQQGGYNQSAKLKTIDNALNLPGGESELGCINIGGDQNLQKNKKGQGERLKGQ